MVPASLASTPGQAPAHTTPEVYDERDRLVILTPCYGGLVTTLFRDSVHVVQTQAPKAYFRCADGQVRHLPIVAMAINHPGDSHIDRARNNIIHDFLATPYRLGLFIDGDQPFEPEDIAVTWVRLMSGVRVVGGTVALKIIKATFACNTVNNTRAIDPSNGMLPGRDTGTGWLGFNRDVLDEIRTRWPQFVREQIARTITDFVDVAAFPKTPVVDALINALARLGYSADIAYTCNPNSAHGGQTVHAYFASGVAYRDGMSDWLSEDWMFCHRCRLLGIPIWIEPRIRVKHLGPMLFPPDPEQVVEAALQVTGGTRPPFNPALASRAHEALKALHADITDESITVIHATRRPEQALAIRAEFMAKAADPAGIEYIFGVDSEGHGAAMMLDSPSSRYVTALNLRGGIVAPFNAAAAQARGRILVMAADDCHPPQGWDQQIREALRGQLHLPRLLWVSDGYSDQPVATHPIITRALYEQNGGWFFCPDYPHLFCDTELTERALNRGEVVDGRHIVFRHDHPMFTGAKPDALHQERNSPEAWATGREIFQRRNPNSKHAHLRA